MMSNERKLAEANNNYISRSTDKIQAYRSCRGTSLCPHHAGLFPVFHDYMLNKLGMGVVMILG